MNLDHDMNIFLLRKYDKFGLGILTWVGLSSLVWDNPFQIYEEYQESVLKVEDQRRGILSLGFIKKRKFVYERGIHSFVINYFVNLTQMKCM